MQGTAKRSLAADGEGSDSKRAKTKKQWRTPRKGEDTRRAIEAGDSGIWATCDKGKEAKCVGELKDLFTEVAESMYSDLSEAKDDAADGSADINIEADIAQELEGLRKPVADPPIQSVRIDVQCVLFFKTRPPIEPVAFVRRICEDAAKDTERKRTRFAKRLTPMTLMGKATEKGIEEVAKQVLAPHFHQEPIVQKK
ncbi:hypothetical protein LTR28_013754, partial [Elasticomyces elasticus]